MQQQLKDLEAVTNPIVTKLYGASGGAPGGAPGGGAFSLRMNVLQGDVENNELSR